MYLVSIYFDDETNKKISQHIKSVATHTGNAYMLEGKVPPHITISSFDCNDEETIIKTLENAISKISPGTLQWASVGAFFPYVIYLAPVLNQYLHDLSVTIYDSLQAIPGITISKYYRPFQWLPHTTIAKKLSPEEMRIAFNILQNTFGMFSGKVTHIGLSKTIPYRDIICWKL